MNTKAIHWTSVTRHTYLEMNYARVSIPCIQAESPLKWTVVTRIDSVCCWHRGERGCCQVAVEGLCWVNGVCRIATAWRRAATGWLRAECGRHLLFKSFIKVGQEILTQVEDSLVFIRRTFLWLHVWKNVNYLPGRRWVTRAEKLRGCYCFDLEIWIIQSLECLEKQMISFDHCIGFGASHKTHKPIL